MLYYFITLPILPFGYVTVLFYYTHYVTILCMLLYNCITLSVQLFIQSSTTTLHCDLVVKNNPAGSPRSPWKATHVLVKVVTDLENKHSRIFMSPQKVCQAHREQNYLVKVR